MPFDLTEAPWVPCTYLDGRRTELGLREVLVCAHEIESIDDGSPLVTLALHRMLLAILHRVFGPPTLRAWADLYRQGAFESAPLEQYLADWRERFDLLHPTRPFYQTAGLDQLGYEADGVGRLVFERFNYGAGVNVFAHRDAAHAATDSLSFAAAARALLALQAFAPGGLVKKKGEPTSATAAPLNRGAFVLVRGPNLHRTLLMNLLVYDPADGSPIPGDPQRDTPSWEQPPLARPGAEEPKRAPHGWVDLLTWQARRVLLVIEQAHERVRGVFHCVGQGLGSDGPIDPMLAVRVDRAFGLVPIGISEERALWRDVHALIRHTDADGARAPRAILQLARHELREVVGETPTLSLDILGMRGDQAKIKLFRHERLSIPRRLIEDADRCAAVEVGSSLIEECSRKLEYAVRIAARWALAPGAAREPERGDVSNLASAIGASRIFFGRMAQQFEAFLDLLAREGDAPALAALQAAIRRESQDVLRLCCDALGWGAGKLRGAALAERSLHRSLAELIPFSQGDLS